MAITAPQATWAALGVVAGAVEVYGLSLDERRRWTLSRVSRRALRCHTPEGRAFTTVLLGAGSAWLVNHLLSVTPTEE